MDGRHAQLLRRREVERQVIHEHAAVGGEADRLRAQLVDARGGLANSDFAGQHDAVEELAEQAVRVAAGAPRVGDEARPYPRAAGLAHGVHHRLLGQAAREEAVDQAFSRRHAQLPRQAQLEVRLSHASLLEREQQLARLRVGTEDPCERVRVQPLGSAEGAEGGHQVGRHHPAPVDQQTVQRSAVGVLAAGSLLTLHRPPLRPGQRARARHRRTA